MKPKLDCRYRESQALSDLPIAQFVENAEIEDRSIIGAGLLHAVPHGLFYFMRGKVVLGSDFALPATEPFVREHRLQPSQSVSSCAF